MIDWRSWNHNLPSVGALIVLGWLYALATGPWRERLAPGTAYPRREAGRFFGGLLFGYVALGSPLAQAGEEFLFSAHLLQHLILLYPAAALLVTGLPAWLADGLARKLGAPFKALVHPLTAGILFVLFLTAWHLPRLYEAALEDGAVRFAQYASLLAVGALFWWPLLSPSTVRPRSRPGALMAYLFAIEVALTGVFSYVLMAEHAMYLTYETAPRLLPWLSALDDQIFAGILLSLVSSIVLVGAIGLHFFRWARKSS